MGMINVLSFEVANLIAAGEVVDRPASAIKEMIENSIDAGAKHITVEIQNGGITFMRISDDGCGMEPSDLPLAIQRHATSKIKSAEDLDGICTLGFRGEALAAISAVSRLRIISKTRDAALGSELVVNCGQVVSQSERGCSDGTTIIAEDLFANVPARRKFLKRDVTETTAVCANVEKIALSHPEIAFRLICDGQVKIDTAGDGKLYSAIYAVFGRDFANRLLPVESEFDGISVKGYIGRSDNVKSNRNYMNFYINKRFVKSRTASAAMEQAYTSYMPSEKFPVCVLFISLNPARVDVNVHPAKLEVKFSNEKPVFEAIYYAVRQVLEQNVTRPDMELKSATPAGVRMSDAFVPVEKQQSVKARQITWESLAKTQAEKTASRQEERPIPMPVRQVPPRAARAIEEVCEKEKTAGQPSEMQSIAEPIGISKKLMITAEEYIEKYMTVEESSNLMPVDRVQTDLGEKVPAIVTETELQDRTAEEQPPTVILDNPPITEEVPGITEQSKAEEVSNSAALKKKPIQETFLLPEVEPIIPQKIAYRIVGEVFNSYIIVELDGKMLLIDKHAAHERIIFEQLKKNMYANQVDSQLLLLPIDIMLMSDEVAVIEEYREEIGNIGFEFSASRNTISVTAIPVGIEQDAVADMFAVMADRIKNGTGKVELTRNILFEKALYQASCKAAIKAGREYASGHTDWIVEKLMEIPDITFCPHGRPVAMEMSKKNIDRQFERT